MEQEELTPDWLSLRHRVVFALRRLCGGSQRLSDIRVAIYGPAALTALARRSGEISTRCRSSRSMRCTPNQNCSSSRRTFQN